ncbi:MAG: GTP cyclohydrolase I FolE [Zetaproteobacteria bacterium]|nr:GTP cyclohydrolase I FolE [Zetaproteobacteria bacterium]
MSDKEREKHLQNMSGILAYLGEDPKREGLEKTPARYLDSMKYFTRGYQETPKQIIAEALFKVDYNDMVIVRDIEFYSLCEHHLVPFYGRCHIGYIPNGRVVGLSKIPRIVEVFSRRLQVQEQLTHEIGKAFEETLAPQGVGIVMEAYHLCMMMRGIEKQRAFTVTSSMLGCFRKQETRQEFMAHLRSPRP